MKSISKKEKDSSCLSLNIISRNNPWWLHTLLLKMIQSRITLREKDSLWTQRNGIAELHSPASRGTNAPSFFWSKCFWTWVNEQNSALKNWFLYSPKIFGPDQNILVLAKICFKLLEGLGNCHKSREDQCTAVVYQRPKQLTEALADEVLS